MPNRLLVNRRNLDKRRGAIIAVDAVVISPEAILRPTGAINPEMEIRTGGPRNRIPALSATLNEVQTETGISPIGGDVVVGGEAKGAA